MFPTRAPPREKCSDLKERSRSFEQVSTIDSVDANLEYAGEMEHVAAASVSDDFLPLLGARPALGRTLDSRIDEGKQQALRDSDQRRVVAPPVFRRPRRNREAPCASTISTVQIAGVLPPGFRLFLPPSVNASEQIDVWFPYRIERNAPVPRRPDHGAAQARRHARSGERRAANARGAIRAGAPGFLFRRERMASIAI